MVKKNMEMPPPPAPKKQTQAPPAGPSREFLELTARLRMMEERYNELNNKAELIEQNMLIKNKKITNEVRAFKEDLEKLRSEITEIKDKIITIINEIKLLARKEDVQVLKKYLEYWKPANFITRSQLDEEITKLKAEMLKKKTLIREKHKIDYIK